MRRFLGVFVFTAFALVSTGVAADTDKAAQEQAKKEEKAKKAAEDKAKADKIKAQKESAKNKKVKTKDDPDEIGNRDVGKGVNFYFIEKEIVLGKGLA